MYFSAKNEGLQLSLFQSTVLKKLNLLNITKTDLTKILKKFTIHGSICKGWAIGEHVKEKKHLKILTTNSVNI